MDGPVEEHVRTGNLSLHLPGPCAKAVMAVFGSFFLLALLSVPVTTTTSRTRQDEGSNLVVRTTYPRETSMFLPQYLSMKAHPPAGTTVRLRPTPWVATMVIVVFLGLVDYVFFCRLLCWGRRREQDSEPDAEEPLA
jgi:hypothetical protein